MGKPWTVKNPHCHTGISTSSGYHMNWGKGETRVRNAGQSSYWRESSGASLCIPSLLSDLTLPKIGLYMDMLLMEQCAVKSLVLRQEVCMARSTLLMESRAIPPIGTAGNSVPDLSCAHLAIPGLECLTQKANRNEFSGHCRHAHLPASCFLLLCQPASLLPPCVHPA